MSNFPLQAFRSGGSSFEKAVVLVHGFTGTSDATWDQFQKVLSQDSETADWDLFGLGYPTSGLPDIMGVWAADPDIPTIASLIATRCKVSDLKRYRSLAFVAHSMGGLVVQRVILNDDEIAKKTSHLIMFGTPSNGLKKAGYARFFKRSIKNMAANSPFVTRLRHQWKERYPTFSSLPFRLAVAAGARDQFVSLESCHADFPNEALFVVDGDHLSMLKPREISEDSVRLVVSELKQVGTSHRTVMPKGESFIDMISFRQKALPALTNREPGIEAHHLVRNALDLERKGYPHDAIGLLRSGLLNEKNLSTWTTPERCDVMGSLGGQLKRCWLSDRESGEHLTLGDVYDVSSRTASVPLGEFCAKEAYDLYSQGLLVSLIEDETDQIYYHAINVAFMALVYLKDRNFMKKCAATALVHAEKSKNPDAYWAVATRAEANLYLGQFEEAARLYKIASDLSTKPDNSDTTIIQAFVAAAELDKREWTHKLDSILTPWADEVDKIGGISHNPEDHPDLS